MAVGVAFTSVSLKFAYIFRVGAYRRKHNAHSHTIPSVIQAA